MSSGEYTDKVKKQQQPGEQVDTVNILAEGYPANWQHAVIHLNPETGEMHSGGDSRVRVYVEGLREALVAAQHTLAMAERQRLERIEQAARALSDAEFAADGVEGRGDAEQAILRLLYNAWRELRAALAAPQEGQE